ncbi:MAG: 16S rRNA (cytosine(1402)-N(4))-methyltransferase RsmH [bacterium]|nr:16S rRNA (cytosine(1402)-N(4))-methyltransferase RsmH [bacterium]
MAHTPVLLHESIEALDLKPGKIFLDATYGAGGHSQEVIRRYGDKVKVISIDQDPEAGASITGNFRDLDKLLREEHPDAILFDLGISSNQLEESGRGFSFLKGEPLDMRMSGPPLDKLGASRLTAADILNSWDEHAIELILRGFGEERFSKKIARKIVERREMKPFKTTFDLVGVVVEVKPRSWRDKIHPATKTFQALRIATNEELTALEEGLTKGFELLKPGGRFAVISFHSLEDRIVKNFFRDKVKEKTAKQITSPRLGSGGARKPVTAGQEEVKANPRSRSAKLRVIEKL